MLDLAARTLPKRRATPGIEPRRVLLVRPDHVGDVLLSAPAVGRLRAGLPRAELTYLVGPWSFEAARHGPPVDHLEALAFPGFTRHENANLVEPYLLLARTAARLRQRQFDMAVILRPDHWWGALLAQAAGIPLRVGARTPETAPLLTHARAPVLTEHAVEQACGLARLALEAVGHAAAAVPPGWPMFTPPEAAHEAALALLRAHGLADAQRLIILQPAAGAALKSWPTSYWAALADGLADAGMSVLLVGAPGDGPLLEVIHERARSRPARQTGQSLAVSAALYARCRVLVAPDSGAAHLAAAVGTPTVRLYGPAPARAYGPWPPRADQRVLVTSRLACVPCGDLVSPPCGAAAQPACLLALSVANVLSATLELLKRSRRRAFEEDELPEEEA